MFRRSVTKLAGTPALFPAAFAQAILGRDPEPVQLIPVFITQPLQCLPLGTDRARAGLKEGVREFDANNSESID